MGLLMWVSDQCSSSNIAVILFLTCIIDYIHYKVWHEITYPFPNFNSAAVEVWECISNFIQHLTGMWLLIHVGKRGKYIHQWNAYRSVDGLSPVWQTYIIIWYTANLLWTAPIEKIMSEFPPQKRCVKTVICKMSANLFRPQFANAVLSCISVTLASNALQQTYIHW